MSTIPQVAPRQCGRCRQSFDGDPSLYPGALAEWWLCPPCRTALLGDGRGRSAPPTQQTSTGAPHAG